MEQIIDLTCDNRLRRQIQENLQSFKYRVHEGSHLKQAAVAITVVCVDNSSHHDDVSSCHFGEQDAALILTRRSTHLQHHAGQWAIPGGRREKGEASENTALRELEEEVDLLLTQDQVLGRLDDFTTRSGFIMTPYVIWGGSAVNLKPNPREVESIHAIPIQEFLRPDAPILEDTSHGNHPVLYMPIGNSWIASPTAALLYQFREVAILGRSTRVAHFDQPMFAWK